ncbi:hypothetical protein SOP87_30985, partial [Bacillus cereus]|uniref:hypothetical protein n=1 Tax=Bacillus cereus TaxID=1396 RepID=UPI002B251F3D
LQRNTDSCQNTSSQPKQWNKATTVEMQVPTEPQLLNRSLSLVQNRLELYRHLCARELEFRFRF